MILHRIAESHAQLECLRWINDNVDLEGVAGLYTAGADAVLVELSDGARWTVTYTTDGIAVTQEEDIP